MDAAPISTASMVQPPPADLAPHVPTGPSPINTPDVARPSDRPTEGNRHEGVTQSPPRQKVSHAAQVSRDAHWPLKTIVWPPHSDRRALIVMQARNGPCSLIALCNVLILRDEITIHPPERRSVSYEYLASLIADWIVTRMEDTALDGLSAALQKLPDLQEGMDINSMWSSPFSFKQAGEGGELKLFGLCGVELVHGWLADPSSSEYEGLIRVGDYDAALNLIVMADDITRGQLVETPGEPHGQTGFTGFQDLSPEQKKHVSDAIAIRQFLDLNSSQLTYYGLFTLSTTLQPGLYALFRNSHLSVLYKSASSEEPLYTLVTDSAFRNEPNVVWETLEDVDGSASTFVDSSFLRSSTAGGDFSGADAESALTEIERAMRALEVQGDSELAQQLQAEEDAATREAIRRHEAKRAAYEAAQLTRAPVGESHSRERSSTPTRTPQPTEPLPPSSESRSSLKSKKSKGEKECVIM